MSRPRHLRLPEELTELVKAQVLGERREPGFLGDDPDDALPPASDDDEALFADHDAVRGHGRGQYVADAEEAASRTLDAMDLGDPDRGPIPLPPAGEADDAVELAFTPRSGS